MAETKNEKKENLEIQSDSTNKVDVYKKATDLTSYEISILPRARVIMKRVEGKTQSGEVYRRYSLTLNLAPGCIYTVDSSNFKESDFYYLVYNVFAEKYNDAVDLSVYDRKIPIRFLTGKYLNKNGEVNDYHMIQIIFKQGIVYSVSVRNQNREYETLCSSEKYGLVPKINWVEKPGVTEPVKDDLGNLVYLYE